MGQPMLLRQAKGTYASRDGWNAALRIQSKRCKSVVAQTSDWTGAEPAGRKRIPCATNGRQKRGGPASASGLWAPTSPH